MEGGRGGGVGDVKRFVVARDGEAAITKSDTPYFAAQVALLFFIFSVIK